MEKTLAKLLIQIKCIHIFFLIVNVQYLRFFSEHFLLGLEVNLPSRDDLIPCRSFFKDFNVVTRSGELRGNYA
jgi:hypothetical protein